MEHVRDIRDWGVAGAERGLPQEKGKNWRDNSCDLSTDFCLLALFTHLFYFTIW